MLAPPSDAAGAVSRFARAWNTEDAAERLVLLRSCCAPDAEFASAHGATRGLEPFNATIGAFLRAFPRAEVSFGTPDAYAGNVRVRWRTLFNDGSSAPTFGDDLMLLNAENQITKVVSFDGSPADA